MTISTDVDHGRRLALVMTVVAIILLSLLTLVVGGAWGPLRHLDQVLAQRAYAATFGHGGRTSAWIDVTTWGGPGSARLCLVVGAVWAGWRHHTTIAAWLVLLLLIETVVAPASKLVLQRPRPSWAHPIAEAGSSSFPSGHATAAASVAVAVVLVTSALAVRRGISIVLDSMAIAVAVTVAASRVFLGVHYLSDVVGGAVLGCLLAASTYLMADWVVDRVVGARSRRHTTNGPIAGPER